MVRAIGTTAILCGCSPASHGTIPLRVDRGFLVALHPSGRCHVTRPTAPSSGPPLLVGRSREQSLLRAQLSAALAGQGGLVILSGEAGIGKTTLAENICLEASTAGALVLAGHCYDRTETPPYG